VNIELLPGLTNVLRFPVELRVPPSMELIHAIEPDVREVLRTGESFFLELPEQDLRDRVDAETARYIAEHILPLALDERGPALEELLRPVVARAVAACRQADQVSRRAVEAQERLHQARTQGRSWMDALEERANELVDETAELLILAHRRCEEAHGVNRAVGLARRDEAWTPDSLAKVSDWLVAAGEADRVCRANGMS